MLSLFSMTTTSPVLRQRGTQQKMEEQNIPHTFPEYQSPINYIFVAGAFILFLLMIRG